MPDINSLGTELKGPFCSLESESAARSLSLPVLGSAKSAWEHENANPIPFSHEGSLIGNSIHIVQNRDWLSLTQCNECKYEDSFELMG